MFNIYKIISPQGLITFIMFILNQYYGVIPISESEFNIS